MKGSTGFRKELRGGVGIPVRGVEGGKGLPKWLGIDFGRRELFEEFRWR